MADDPKLALEKVLLSEAAEIAAAREKCLILHATKDIDAAGDEVEICIRSLLRKRLGQNYYVGHGHIIDASWNVSPQFDVIVADASVIPAVFKSENGTEYFPYEAVYAVGEVKATYRKSRAAISKFVSAIRALRKLHRADVPANYVRTHSGGFYLGSGLSAGERKGTQNNLFTFMVFAGAGDFKAEDVTPVYTENSAGDLPNAVCILDKGLLVYTLFDKLSLADGSYEKVSLVPLPSKPAVKSDRTFAWTLFSNGDGEPRALSWGILYGLLAQHLLHTTLMPESPILYFQGLASSTSYQLLTEPESLGESDESR